MQQDKKTCVICTSVLSIKASSVYPLARRPNREARGKERKHLKRPCLTPLGNTTFGGRRGYQYKLLREPLFEGHDESTNQHAERFGSAGEAHISQSGGCHPLGRDAQPKTVATRGVVRAKPPQEQPHRPDIFYLEEGTRQQ